MGTGISRRAMLAASAGGIALVSASGAGAAVAASRSSTGAPASAPAPTGGIAGDPSRPMRSEFTGHLGGTYDAVSPWAPHRLRLESVGDLAPGGDGENAFRLSFSTDDTARDGIYHLTSPAGTRHVIYLGRVGPAAGTLEAIVDRTR
ncbi:DUF6916 family protein [Microbacterium sp. ASV49]|uniref:DUF6916 domain-containing protein n=1 Tax=Microbacterium candidum TaxID=3041922 RepID=A0ABT7MYI4_9MICO|nr:hypothetical protein [Microbacterium sp. ASV49]MDL9979513.1 hypothetical protein [Microbacterium sp. ASV49]